MAIARMSVAVVVQLEKKIASKISESRSDL